MCSAVALTRLHIRYCDQCQSAMYCSKACQKKDWKPRHKQICNLLNVGHGGMQVRNEDHMRRSILWMEQFERDKHNLDEGKKRFFKLFEESTIEGSRAAARKMKKYAKRQTKRDQNFLLQHCLYLLVQSSNSEMLSWPNSPLLVLLQFVDPNVLFANSGDTPLHCLAILTDCFDHSTHANQPILAKQLIERGANVSAVSISMGATPLHYACHWATITNLDFVELVLEKGADPNAQDLHGLTPLMNTTKHAPGAAKFLLSWPATDVTITDRSGGSFPGRVRCAIVYFSDKVALLDNPEQVRHQFLLQQWRDIENMLVEKEAIDATE
jgi:hypothetical protein